MKRPKCKTPTDFEHITRYLGSEGDVFVKILPGEFYVTSAPEVLTTLLGSCVSACIRDPFLGIGGMNHFMLPQHGDHWSEDLNDANRYGTWAMENLIGEIVNLGGRRERLEVKLFGGAATGSLNARIGDQNIAFVEQFLASQGVKVAARSLGGHSARRVVYYLDTGRVRVLTLPRTESHSGAAGRPRARSCTVGHP